MRALGMIALLLLVGLGLALAPGRADAAPCPHHGHELASGMGERPAPAHGSAVGKVAAASVAGAVPAAVVSASAAEPGHAAPHGGLCCLAAMAGAVALAPVPEPCRPLATRAPVRSSRLPPWAVPASGIFRPPAQG